MEAIKVVMENIPCLVDDIYNGTTWLTFTDCMRLRFTCSDLYTRITDYGKFQFTVLDYRLYNEVRTYGWRYLFNENGLVNTV